MESNSNIINDEVIDRVLSQIDWNIFNQTGSLDNEQMDQIKKMIENKMKQEQVKDMILKVARSIDGSSNSETQEDGIDKIKYIKIFYF